MKPTTANVWSFSLVCYILSIPASFFPPRIKAMVPYPHFFQSRPFQPSLSISYHANYPFLFQAPKSLPPAAKQALILTHLRASNTVFTLKELEKILPGVASINGMQVKDYVQALVDENQIRVEKIGSGNWYWSFLSDEKKAKENVLETLRTEKGKLDASKAELLAAIEVSKAGRGSDEDDGKRTEMVARYEALEAEVQGLQVELTGYGECDPVELARKREEIEEFKVKAERWTDNIYCLEEYLKEVTGGDREALERVRAECYGDEYVEGEGLREF